MSRNDQTIDTTAPAAPPNTTLSGAQIDTPTIKTRPQTNAGGQAKDYSTWRARIAKCRQLRRRFIVNWSTNIDYRRGKQFDTDSDQDRIAITIDWSATKAKQAQLFSQVPEVRLTEKDPLYAQAVPIFAKKLNEALGAARVGVALDESLPDMINAAGVGAVIIAYESRTEMKQVPAVPPDVALQMKEAGQADQIPMTDMPFPADVRFTITRISPGDLLWGVEFVGSDFDDGGWIGRSGRCNWSEAKEYLNLTEDDKENVVGLDDRSVIDLLTHDAERERFKESEVVGFEELFFWNYKYDPTETRFNAIQRLVFVHGKPDPVIDEPWKGQKRNANGDIIGAQKLPIRVCTLTYITDECIPPSDTAIGRPQTDELIRARSQMVRQREASLPLRWFDVNRVSTAVQDTLQRGTWQGMIPMNGDGSRAIGEVARANYAPEDFSFQRIAKEDLSESWQVTPGQIGSTGPAVRSATVGEIAERNFQTRIGYERARVVRYFVGIAEVLAGLLALYGTFTDAEKQALQAWDRETLANSFVYSVRADSTVLLTAEQQIERLMSFLNMTAKSGYVNVKPVITTIAELQGLNPADVVHDPNPPAPDAMNVSLRCTGAADLLNPVVMALLMKSGQAPDPGMIDAAKKLLQAASMPTPPPLETGLPGAPPPGAAPPTGAGPGQPMSGRPPAPGAAPGPPQAGPGPHPTGPGPHPPLAGPPHPGAPGDAHPEWNTLSRIEKRADEGPQKP